MKSSKGKQVKDSTKLDLIIDAACSRFEQEWTPEDGLVLMKELVQLHRYPESTGRLLTELIAIDCELRSKHHQPLKPNAIRSHFSYHYTAVLEGLQKAEGHPPNTSTSNLKGLKKLAGYQIVREIDRGGSAVIFEAIQADLDRRVAVKVLTANHRNVPDLKQRFESESTLIARLAHPHIVSVFGSGVDNGLCYYAMEFIDGGSISDLIQQRCQANQKLNGAWFDKAARWMADAADAVQCAHDGNVLHRDIKPGNLLVDKNDVIRLADFGLARLANIDNHVTGNNLVSGSLRYLPPEALSGTRDERSDIHGLGLTLFELLTLQPARAQDNREILIHDIAKSEIRPPQDVVPTLPRDLQTIILKASAFSPEDRYTTASAFAEDLRRFVDGRPILARSTSKIERVAKWTRRNPLAATLGTLLMTCIPALALVLNAWISEQEITEQAENKINDLQQQFSSDFANATAVAKQELSRAEIAQQAKTASKYALTTNSIQRAIEAGNDADAAAQISRYETKLQTLLQENQNALDPRDWEWEHLKRQVDQAAITINTGDDEVFALSLSPTGNHFATIGGNYEFNQTHVRIFDAQDGRQIRLILAEEEAFFDAAFSPDGKTLATISLNSGPDPLTVELVGDRDPSNRKDLTEFDLDLAITWDQFKDADKGILKELANPSDEFMQFLQNLADQPEAYEELSQKLDNDLKQVIQSADQDAIQSLSQMAAGTQGWIKTWNLETGQRLNAQKLPEWFPIEQMVTINVAGEGPHIQYFDQNLILTSGPIVAFDATTLDIQWQHLGIQMACLDQQIVAFDFESDTIRLLEPRSGKPLTKKPQKSETKLDFMALRIHRLPTPEPQFSYLSFDGEKLSVSQVNELKLVDSNVFEIKESTWATITPEGQLIRAEFGGKLIVQEAKPKGKTLRVLSGHTNSIVTGVFSADKRWLYTLDETGMVRIWDYHNASPITKFNIPNKRAPVETIAFSKSADRVHFASSSFEFHNAPTAGWVTTDGRQQKTQNLKTTYHELSRRNDIALSDDGQFLAAPAQESKRPENMQLVGSYSNTGKIHIWSTEDGQRQSTIELGPRNITAITWSNDLDRLAVATKIKNDIQLAVIDLKHLELNKLLLKSNQTSPSKTDDSSSRDNVAPPVTWLSATGPLIESVRFIPNQNRIALATDSGVSVMSMDGTVIQEFHKQLDPTANVTEDENPGTSLDIDSTGRFLATARTHDQSVKVFDLQTAELIMSAEAPPAVCSVCFSPNSKRLAAVGAHSIVRLYDFQAGHRLLTLDGRSDIRPAHPGSKVKVAFSPDGTRLATTTYGSRITIWDGRPSIYRDACEQTESTDFGKH